MVSCFIDFTMVGTSVGLLRNIARTLVFISASCIPHCCIMLTLHTSNNCQGGEDLTTDFVICVNFARKVSFAIENTGSPRFWSTWETQESTANFALEALQNVNRR